MQGYSAGGQSELRVNTAELRSGGKGLEDAANSIPPPPEQFSSDGTDELSKALIRLTQEKEAALIEGLPQVKKDSLKTAQDIGVAADRYETTDQEIADTIMKRVAEFDALFHPEKTGGSGAPGSGGQFGQLVSGSGGGGPSATSAGSPGGSPEGATSASSGASAAGEAGSSSGQDPLQMLQQMGQQMVQMPMQMMQQAGQLPQGIMQAAQSGIQQISQMAGEVGKNGDAERADEAESEGKDQQEPEKKAPTAPVPGAGDGGSPTERAPVGGPSSGGASENAPAGPKHEAAPVNPAPRKAPTDSSILL
ncbi:hypothetical protein VST63_25255 [Mycolicibacterium sp. 050232]|uniref:hypothetical protein n=1 Tax=Mycolicibacterium sp. 050232 TaxID=3113982 RepID=UPI002E29027C|nr:hypothetical protein [Mycolicibacterium sp. 050232]MED5815682.1 hypothetical protein [Mycolicibacterium sp. 050232]